MNVPYRREHGKIGPEGYKNEFPNRRTRRSNTVNKGRPFSNKKGIQLVVTQIANYEFVKFEKKVIQQGPKGTRVQYQERVKRK